jgi:hypothetical protein
LFLAPWLVLFVAPLHTEAQVPPGDLGQSAKVQREMLAFDPDYPKSVRSRAVEALSLAARVRTIEASGRKTSCSHQILNETLWMLGHTAEFARIDARLRDLKASIAAPERESIADEQDPEDGSWGRCYTEWSFKLDASLDHLLLDPDRAPPVPMRLLDRVNSPEKLTAFLTAISVSDIPRTGIDYRREFNETLGNLVRLILRDRPRGYPWHPQLKQTLRGLVFNQLRNRETGWWGERYVRNGGVEFVDDLSTTFHVVTYLKGDVPDLGIMVNTLLAVKDEPYPVGWLNGKGYSNHHNMDVVSLLRIGWPYLKAEQKQMASAEIDKMLHWCLRESLQEDGSFRAQIGDDSLEELTYFGVEFLARIGYFDQSRRFWTTDEFPGAEAARQKIVAFIEKHIATGGAGGEYYRSALKDLKL